ncbi:MAG: c-type cytochrome [Chitinophagales bacterium]|nr:c-type cytochrome [Chitinophagales bacterium]
MFKLQSSIKPILVIIGLTMINILQAQDATATATEPITQSVPLDIANMVLGILAVFLFLVILYLMKVSRKIGELPSKGNTLKTLLLLVSLGGAANLMGQDATTAETVAKAPLFQPIEWYYLLFGLVFGEFVALLILVFNIVKQVDVKSGKEHSYNPFANISWGKMNVVLNDAIPIEREGEIMTDHEYDGIRELDNNLPPWWKYGFYISLVAAVIYMLYFHGFGGKLQEAEYLAEVEQADKAMEARLAKNGGGIDESNVTLLTDAGKYGAANGIFQSMCASCHGAKGEGGVGPNLTDKYWLHGGTVQDIFKTVKYGVTAKGMPAWEKQIAPDMVQKLASYIISLNGTNPPNGKAPQGDLFNGDPAGGGAAAAPTDSTKTDTTATK